MPLSLQVIGQINFTFLIRHWGTCTSSQITSKITYFRQNVRLSLSTLLTGLSFPFLYAFLLIKVSYSWIKHFDLYVHGILQVHDPTHKSQRKQFVTEILIAPTISLSRDTGWLQNWSLKFISTLIFFSEISVDPSFFLDAPDCLYRRSLRYLTLTTA